MQIWGTYNSVDWMKERVNITENWEISKSVRMAKKIDKSETKINVSQNKRRQECKEERHERRFRNE